MKIAIDVTRAVIGSAGIGRYTLELVKHMLAVDHENQYLIFSTHYNDSPEKDMRLKSFEAPNVKIKRLKIPGSLKENMWGWRINFMRFFLEGSDVLYAPSNFEVLLGARIPQVVTIYDMTTALFPTHRGQQESDFETGRSIQVCQKAKKIICISESTKNDLLRLTKTPEVKISVIYPGLTKFSKPANKNLYDLKKDGYILSVGTIEPRKNLIGLLRAYAMLDESLKKKFPLILVGGKGWNDSKIFDEFNSLKLQKYAKFTGFVEDATLARLYQDCKVFAYVSLYEGFGLPVVEALSFARPVVTSNVSSMPEAAGDSAALVDPNNPKEISRALEKVLTDSRYAAKLTKGAKQQAGKFSWTEAAKLTIDVIKKAK